MLRIVPLRLLGLLVCCCIVWWNAAKVGWGPGLQVCLVCAGGGCALLLCAQVGRWGRFGALYFPSVGRLNWTAGVVGSAAVIGVGQLLASAVVARAVSCSMSWAFVVSYLGGKAACAKLGCCNWRDPSGWRWRWPLALVEVGMLSMICLGGVVANALGGPKVGQVLLVGLVAVRSVSMLGRGAVDVVKWCVEVLCYAIVSART